MINPYKATGQVIDLDSNEGIANVRVEVWDVQSKTQKPLATATTESNGRFTVSIDFIQAGFQDIPDIIFKVFRNSRELSGKESSFTWNSESQEDVTLFVQKTPVNRVVAKDRFTTEQVLKAGDFVKNVNFIGLFNGVKEQAGDRFGMIGKVLASALPHVDFTKIALPTNVDKAVVNKDVKTATDYLATQKIEVNDVKPVDKQLKTSTLKELLTLPVSVKAGEKVNLYEENGTVKYYSVVPAPTAAAPASTPAATVPVATSDEVVKLRKDLEASKKDTDDKNKMIAKLQADLAAVRETQEQHTKVIQSKEFQTFLKAQATTTKKSTK